ncbi:MAG: bifunctional 23S rRNA (guanine2445-N2)-methyltransferase / 23S rRNA (guanine2069-N7)-methyltransfera [Idiomarinaceae bacterium HL-53]|nr:MAG: bifunctional 23S rRNA (guanine2445-N2)-methyltransferase / 23S rRNA (guanine2069-N7)-methyltransfera [Idiomarinaceae bacterium HL-53]CUS49010.1 23S rRNA (guanine2445-N2)-methyltransferase / 23S rRNA (guanine2069-N7)-methyltransferase [Idiomarinaceae bacterium HL-53]
MLSLYLTCAHGLEELLMQELSEFAVSDIKRTHGGMYLQASRPTMYQMMLQLRTASRVYLSLGSFDVHDRETLLSAVQSVDWQAHVNPKRDFVVKFQGTSKVLKHSGFAAQVVKDGYLDYWRAHDERPSVSKDFAETHIYVNLAKGKASIYLDLSGRGLHERGYRTATGPAPIRETLAAAIALRALQLITEPSEPLTIVDPFCGSGTLLLELAMIKTKCPPGLLREDYGWNAWCQHDENEWQKIKDEAVSHFEAARESCNWQFLGYDLDTVVLRYADQGAHKLGLGHLFKFGAIDSSNVHFWEQFNDMHPNGLVISNPPYGERLEAALAARQLYSAIGNGLRELPQTWHAALLGPSDTMLKALKLSSHKKYALKSGPLDIRLALYSFANQLHFERRAKTDIANRLLKNWQARSKWAKHEGIEAFRVYDADLPDYNAAIDYYLDHWVVQEYQAPKSIEPEKAEARWWDLIDTLMETLPVDPAKIFLKQRRRQKGEQQYTKVAADEEAVRFVCQEYNAQFWVNLTHYLDTGLFLDHRIVRKDIQYRAREKRVLNLFAYTGTASVHAALGGASEVTTVDMSRTYLNWAKDNFRLNHQTIDKHKFIQADCTTWLTEQATLGTEKWDLIFLDPPTFSNSKRMESHFDIQEDYLSLIQAARACLSEGGLIIFSTNMRKFKFDDRAVSALGLKIEERTEKTIPLDFKRQRAIHYCWYLYYE